MNNILSSDILQWYSLVPFVISFLVFSQHSFLLFSCWNEMLNLSFSERCILFLFCMPLCLYALCIFVKRRWQCLKRPLFSYDKDVWENSLSLSSVCVWRKVWWKMYLYQLSQQFISHNSTWRSKAWCHVWQILIQSVLCGPSADCWGQAVAKHHGFTLTRDPYPSMCVTAHAKIHYLSTEYGKVL